MTATAAVLRRPAAGRLATPTIRAASVALVGILAVGLGTQSPLLARGAVAVAGFSVFVVVAVSSRELALRLVVVWLVLLGFVRRFLIPFAGWSPDDPLLLVGPAAAVVLIVAGRQERPPPRTALSALAGFLLLWSLAGVVNPNETSLVVAAQAAVLQYVGPLLWFFVGRGLDRGGHERLLRTVQWASLPVLALGFYHSFNRFLPFELTWLGVSGQGAAMHLPGFRIRPFSTLVSPQEYGYFLSFVIAITVARLLHGAGHRRWQWLLLVTTYVALFLQASRSIFLFSLLAVAVMFLVRYWSVAASMTVAVGVGVLLFVAITVDVEPPSDSGDRARAPGPVAVLVAHQLSGITQPDQSTAPIHLDLIERGFQQGISQPFGAGVSSGTIAGARAETRVGTSAESDIANTTAALGVPAGLALAAFIAIGLGAAYRMERMAPSWRHLAWLGLGVAAFNQWMSGGLYSTSAILFLALGGLASEVGSQTSGANRPRTRRTARAAP